MQDTDSNTIQDVLDREGAHLSIKSVYTDKNPNMHGMPPGSTHYKVTLTLRYGGKRRRLTTFYSMGPAHTEAPKALDVLDCLISDGRIGRESFEHFCREFGYDEDSRRAERIWKACQKEDKQLDAFLGDLRGDLEEADPR